MEMYRNFKYRLQPNRAQKLLLDQMFFASNQAWNHALALKIEDLKQNSSLPSANRIYKKDSEIEKAVNYGLKLRKIKSNSGMVQETTKSLKKSMKNFFKKKSTPANVGFPSFADSRRTEQSCPFKNQGVSWTLDYLQILKQKIKWNFHRDLSADAKLNQLVIKRESDGNYFAILNLTINQYLPNVSEKPSCGIDMNVKNISIADSDGTERFIKLEDFSKSKYSKRYKSIQQKLSQRYKNKNFSKKTKKLQKELNICHKKIKNKKENNYHHISKELSNTYSEIIHEDLNIQKMKQSKSTRLNRSISDVSWNSLFQKITYKAEMQNVSILKINPAYSSQRCSVCGSVHEDNRKSQSDFQCLKCGFTYNADLNAARNIRDYEQWSLEQMTLISQWNQNPAKCLPDPVMDLELLGDYNLPLEAPCFS